MFSSVGGQIFVGSAGGGGGAGPGTGGTVNTITPISGTAFQVSTAQAAYLWVPITYTPTASAAAVAILSMSATSNPTGNQYYTEVPIGAALDSFIIPTQLFVPKGWYVRITANAQASVGAGFWI